MVAATVGVGVVRRSTAGVDVITEQGVSAISFTTTSSDLLDVSVTVVNNGADVAQLRSASLISLPGYPKAVPGPVGVYQQPDPPLLSIRWPPLRPAAGGTAAFSDQPYPVTGIAGYDLGPKRTVTLVYAMKGDGTDGRFVAAGLRLLYSYDGRDGSSRVWGIGIDCVGPRVGAICAPGLTDTLLSTVDKLRGS